MINTTEKVKLFEQQIVFFQNYRQAFAKLEKAVECTRLRGIPTSAVLIGPSGAGKSTLSTIFQNSFPSPHIEHKHEGIYHVIPAFYCSVPAKVTIKSFCKAILSGLHCNDTSGDTVDLELRIIELLKTCQTQIIIIDEFQILAKRGNYNHLEGLKDWLLALSNSINIPIIIVGTEECAEIIYREPQLARRFPFLVRLKYLEFNEKLDSEYITTLRGLDEKLYEIGNLKPGIHLTDPSICTRLYVASQGNLEYLRQILSLAFSFCLNRNDKKIILADFHDACALIELELSLSPKQNPFSLDLAKCYSIIETHSQ